MRHGWNKEKRWRQEVAGNTQSPVIKIKGTLETRKDRELTFRQTRGRWQQGNNWENMNVETQEWMLVKYKRRLKDNKYTVPLVEQAAASGGKTLVDDISFEPKYEKCSSKLTWMLHRTYSGKQLLNLKLNGCRYVFCYLCSCYWVGTCLINWVSETPLTNLYQILT